jgi:hypothetical protein
MSETSPAQQLAAATEQRRTRERLLVDGVRRLAAQTQLEDGIAALVEAAEEVAPATGAAFRGEGAGLGSAGSSGSAGKASTDLRVAGPMVEVVVEGLRGQRLGVLRLWRSAGEEGFSEEERESLQRLGRLGGPLLEDLQSRAGDEAEMRRVIDRDSLFRREAVEHMVSVAGPFGDLIRLSPVWSRWLLGALAVVAVAAGVAASLLRLPSIVSGPAVVRHPPHLRELVSPEAAEGVRIVGLLPGSSRRFLDGEVRLLFRDPNGSGCKLSLDAAPALAGVVGPSRARRLLGDDIGDAVELRGPIAMLLSEPISPTPGEGCVLYDGMVGVAEMTAGRETLLQRLLPGG